MGVVLGYWPGAVAAQQVAEVQVSPPNQQVQVGERFGFFATAYDANGSVIPGLAVTWASSDVAVATVDASGSVTGVSIGVAQIVARIGDRQGTAVVQVVPVPEVEPPEPPPPAYSLLQIEPRVIYLLPSERVQAQALGVREGETDLGPAEVGWTVADESIVTIDQAGYVVGLSPGRTTVQARAPGGGVATAPVEVQAAELEFDQVGPVYMSPGESMRLQAVVPAQENRPIPPELLGWRSSDPAIVRSEPDGRIVAGRSGTATVSVSGFFQSRSLTVTVHRRVDLMTTAPADTLLYLPIGGERTFSARALASDGTPVLNAPLTWRITDPAVGAFDVESTTLTGLTMGELELTVRGPGPGLEKEWTVRVVPGAIAVRPDRFRMGKATRTDLLAEFMSDDGTPIAPAEAIRWTSDDETVVAVDSAGRVHAADWGETTVRASSAWGAADSARIRVQPEVVVSSNRAAGLYLLYGLEAGDAIELANQYRYGPDTLAMQDPAFSPDGEHLAFSSVSLSDGNTDIFVMDSRGGNVVRLTRHTAADQRPRWTPDGQQVVFQSGRAGQPQVFVMDADGGNVRQVTGGRAAKLTPAVSPDGAWVVYIESTRRADDVYIADRQGGNVRRLTDSRERESVPVFVGDRTVAFLRTWDEGGRTIGQVFQYDLESGTVTPLSVPGRRVTDFAVDPAGTRLGLVILEEVDDVLVRRVFMQSVGESAALVPVGEVEGSSTSGVTFLPTSRP
ncbi:MAG TPA: Ig-like domain-containing protein [Vicinamibacterales bacterium]|nr:Ig-like domain-containing protein [Vicinamibacterales bacterium]